MGVQNADGGWAWNEWGTSSEVQHTAMVVQALLAAGESVTSTEVIRAMAFIASGKNGDGGYAYQPRGPSDANTTSAVVQSQFASCTILGDPCVQPATLAICSACRSWMGAILDRRRSIRHRRPFQR